jgi:predicted nuclease with TOPRIM domain
VKFRARLTRRINRSVAWRIDDHIVDLRTQVDDLRHLLGRVEESTRELADRGADLDKRLGELDRRLDGVQQESAWSANELARLAPQAAAFEARLEEKARPVVLTGDLTDVAEARLLVDVVREEHARVRARLALVSSYEERLRRLEQRPASRP